MLALSACSAALPPTPQPAPGRVFVKSRRFDPKLREAALAGGHPAPSDLPLRMCIGFTLVNQDDFDRRLTDFADRNSPTFGGRFSDEDLKKYERPQSDYETVERWLTSYGIKILSVSTRAAFDPNIRAQGTVAQLESAMNIQINQSANGTFLANMSDPQIPANLAGIILSIRGFDNLDSYSSGPKLPCT